jgi:hypothetical protein
MERHSASCSAEAPSLQELTKLVFMLAHEVEALRSAKTCVPMDAEMEPTAEVLPILDEVDLLGFHKENIDFIVTRHDWPIKVSGKNSLKMFSSNRWTAMTPALLDDVVANLYKQLNDSLFAFCQGKVDEESEKIFAEIGQKLSVLNSASLKRALLANL